MVCVWISKIFFPWAMDLQCSSCREFLLEQEMCYHPLFSIVVPKQFCYCNKESSPIYGPFDGRILTVCRLHYWGYRTQVLVHSFEPLLTARGYAQSVYMVLGYRSHVPGHIKINRWGLRRCVRCLEFVECISKQAAGAAVRPRRTGSQHAGVYKRRLIWFRNLMIRIYKHVNNFIHWWPWRCRSLGA